MRVYLISTGDIIAEIALDFMCRNSAGLSLLDAVESVAAGAGGNHCKKKNSAQNAGTQTTGVAL